ncbi:FadR/GntR family transcriptional regulator [Kineococcus arenarius]|uniref:FadR/GntR family transcriptional regulator n=1 Tax=Kineococcus sp. SYSU DK007 TaxID=3383128 RepID=UPI003D7DA17D
MVDEDPARDGGRGGPRSQTDVVVEGIKRMLAEGVLRPNQKLPVEADLARELGVSRGPLREGVRALSLMGVLESRQGAGTYVTALDSSVLLTPMAFLVDLQQQPGAQALHAVRRLLETEAAGLAALHADEEQVAGLRAALEDSTAAARGASDPHAFVEADIRFHDLVATASGNPVLASLVHAFAGRTARARVWRAIAEDGALERTLQEHRAILRAVQERDPDRARLRMGHHLLAVEDFVAGPGGEGPDEPGGAGAPG